jgi:hypothetical protein
MSTRSNRSGRTFSSAIDLNNTLDTGYAGIQPNPELPNHPSLRNRRRPEANDQHRDSGATLAEDAGSSSVDSSNETHRDQQHQRHGPYRMCMHCPQYYCTECKDSHSGREVSSHICGGYLEQWRVRNGGSIPGSHWLSIRRYWMLMLWRVLYYERFHQDVEEQLGWKKNRLELWNSSGELWWSELWLRITWFLLWVLCCVAMIAVWLAMIPLMTYWWCVEIQPGERKSRFRSW